MENRSASPTWFIATMLLATSAQANIPPASPGFEENKGQVRTMDGLEARQVRFRLVQGDTRIFLLNDGIAYQFVRTHLPGHPFTDRDEQSTLQEQEDLLHAVRHETFRMDMQLVGADPDAVITTRDRSSDHTNYPRYGVQEAYRYGEVTYHEVYPGIDWVVRIHGAGIKYDFVVHPGADPGLIRMGFHHQEELHATPDGGLVQGNRLGRFTEEPPVSFQEGRAIPTRFIHEGNTVRFALDPHDPSRTLVIDPARLWGTYYGGNVNDYGRAVDVDASDNVYLVGYSLSTANIADGGHQSTNGGDLDAILVKFNSDGERLWATYYGGPAADYGRGCAVDGSGNVYMAGYANSGTGIGFNGHQNSIASTDFSDAFLAKFNSSGVLQWGTYYGGEDQDVGRACAVDANDNVLMAGYTRSGGGIASAGHQNTHGGLGELDAFLVKFNSNGVRQWATYYGGAGSDGGNSCITAGTDVYLLGYSAGGDIASNGHQNVHGGGDRDAYLAKFDSDGTRLWGTYYGGSANDEGEDCAVDAAGNVVLSGYTVSTAGIASNGHQATYGGGSRDAMLVKFDADGALQWASYYGGNGYDTGWTCSVDGAGNIYMGGTTDSGSNIAQGGHQNTIGGGEDGYLAKFSADGTRIWGTYYGGNIEDDAYGSVVDNLGHVYLAGTTRSIMAIAQDGHQNAYGGGFNDAFLVKFEGSSTGMPAQFTTTGLRWMGQHGTQHHLALGGWQPDELSVLDAAGRLVRSFGKMPAGERILLDLGGLAPGTYLLQLRETDHQGTLRLLHQ